MQTLKIAAPIGKFLRRGVLEREDRLLLVADDEDRALDRARACAGNKFRDQLADDLPLLRAGVLRLVDQHVVDPEIELVVHPGGIDVAEQIEGLVDEVVVIEEAAAVLLAPDSA